MTKVSDDDDLTYHANLGHMVALVRSLEFDIYRVAECLGVRKPARFPASVAIERARKQMQLGLPPWAQNLLESDVDNWLSQATNVLDDRNKHVHFFHAIRLDNGLAFRLDLRRERASSIDEDELPTLIERAKSACDVGYALLSAHLEVRLPNGQSVPPGEHQGMDPSWLVWWRTRIAAPDVNRASTRGST